MKITHLPVIYKQHYLSNVGTFRSHTTRKLGEEDYYQIHVFYPKQHVSGQPKHLVVAETVNHVIVIYNSSVVFQLASSLSLTGLIFFLK